jgi:hypothetical protein
MHLTNFNGTASSMPRIEALHAECSSVKGVATCAGVKMRGRLSFHTSMRL